ncbi:MAG: CehA/McbA family metallohydrolase [Myxococcota bacterium]|nr:CehA/McbA family metallohydrolase [Myxococcota bacterium]
MKLRTQFERRKGRRPAPGGGTRVSLAVLLVLGAWSCESDSEHPYGVALHLHGSMSEGKASMRAHTQAAEELGEAVDVLWWTDHDWRIAAHTYVDDFDFEEGLEESDLAPVPYREAQWDGRAPPPDWDPPRDPTAPPPANSLEVVEKVWRLSGPEESLPGERVIEVTTREARNGLRSLYLSAEGTRTGPQQIALAFEASRRRHVASLASGVRLRLSALPIELDPQARIIVRVGLSQASPGRGVRLDYVLNAEGLVGSAPAPSREIVRAANSDYEVEVGTVPLAARPGLWSDWVLDLSEDAEALGLGGGDNALVSLNLILEVRGRGRAEAYFDAFAIERDRVGEPLLAEARRMAGALEEGGDLVHHVGQEISYAAHLNAYGPGVPLADASAHPHGFTPGEAVAFVHDHGGLVSLNHFFGVMFDRRIAESARAEPFFKSALERLVENRAYGVDLIEVGYRARGYGLAGYLELWDGLAREGIRLVGVGVSDSHQAELGWLQGPNNFVSWIYARSSSQPDLLAGLGAGRVYFGDPTRFGGRLDIRAEGGGRMGDLLSREPGSLELVFSATGLKPGQSIRLVRDGFSVGEYPSEAPEWSRRARLEIDGPTFVRLEVLEAGERVALSNPLYVELVSGEETPAP